MGFLWLLSAVFYMKMYGSISSRIKWEIGSNFTGKVFRFIACSTSKESLKLTKRSEHSMSAHYAIDNPIANISFVSNKNRHSVEKNPEKLISRLSGFQSNLSPILAMPTKSIQANFLIE